MTPSAPAPLVDLYRHDAYPEATLCAHADGRHFVALSGEIARHHRRPEDGDDALASFNRAFLAAPGMFRQVNPRQPRNCLETEHGFIGDLTDRDRQRLRAIVRRHHKQYFADVPTNAQVDNLIEGIGLRCAEKLVRAAVDGGHI
jgi:hypothetical protein